jgi:hypothetical protein
LAENRYDYSLFTLEADGLNVILRVMAQIKGYVESCGAAVIGAT